MSRALHVCHGSGAQGFAVHDGGVELVGAICGEDRAPTGVEERIVLKKLDGRLNRIQRGAAAIKNLGRCGQSLVYSSAIASLSLGSHAVALNDSRAAVQNDGPLGALDGLAERGSGGRCRSGATSRRGALCQC